MWFKVSKHSEENAAATKVAGHKGADEENS